MGKQLSPTTHRTTLNRFPLPGPGSRKARKESQRDPASPEQKLTEGGHSCPPPRRRAVRSLQAEHGSLQAKHGRPLAKAEPLPCLSIGGQECPPSVIKSVLIRGFPSPPFASLCVLCESHLFWPAFLSLPCHAVVPTGEGGCAFCGYFHHSNDETQNSI